MHFEIPEDCAIPNHFKPKTIERKKHSEFLTRTHIRVVLLEIIGSDIILNNSKCIAGEADF